MQRKSKYLRFALAVSVFLLIVWGMLGTGATLAWFTDTTDVDRNSFLIGQLNVDVSYKNDIQPLYTDMEGRTTVFNDQALYEPGYTQVVYLKIQNNGEIDFDYKLAVDMHSYTDSISLLGTTIHLPEYLRFGVMFADSDAELTRQVARLQAPEEMESFCLNTYSKPDTVTLTPGDIRYAALIVYMPESVGNQANHRDVPPTVQLGITVYAQQAGTPIQN